MALCLHSMCLSICRSILQAVATAVLAQDRFFALQMKAIKLLVDHHEDILPAAVVPALQASCNAQLP